MISDIPENSIHVGRASVTQISRLRAAGGTCIVPGTERLASTSDEGRYHAGSSGLFCQRSRSSRKILYSTNGRLHRDFEITGGIDRLGAPLLLSEDLQRSKLSFKRAFRPQFDRIGNVISQSNRQWFCAGCSDIDVADTHEGRSAPCC
jgi:hypothetical protein